MLVYMNFPEWISRFYMINTPTIMKVIWKSISPILPDSTRRKIHMFGGQSEWLPVGRIHNHILPLLSPLHSHTFTLTFTHFQALLEEVSLDHLPTRWGGTLEKCSADVPVGVARLEDLIFRAGSKI